ncbi:MAG TPA: ATP-binding protein [Caldimonas sp.]|nr:ATP-binding protein [Caldimonas sp.]
MTGRSLRQRYTIVVLTTTAAALLLSALALLIYELRSYRSAWIADLTTQADLVAKSSAAALAFDDVRAANENLALLKLRPQITAAAVYNSAGRLFASYVASDSDALGLPARPAADGHRFEGDNLQISQPVEQNGERVGTLYLTAHYDVGGRLLDYLAILVAVTAASLALAAVIFGSLQNSLTGPILALAQAARDVTRRRDYGVTVRKVSDDEVGELVDSFNDMVRELGAEIDQRQKAEAALRAADRRKDEFLATLAHELRNPLSPIVTGLEVLNNPAASSDAQTRARERMIRQLRQMVRLIDDLLDVSRITTGKVELRRAPVDLVAVVREALDAVESIVKERGHRLDTRWPDAPVPIDGDATRLVQVVVNLLNNAAKYTDRGGHIAVWVGVEDARAVVRVTDDGIGIEPPLQDEVFELFMQADRSLERQRSGLGVGLSLARRFVELHGGTIELHSEGLGRGATFTVRLPLAATAEQAVASSPSPPPGHAKALDVLVADDNVDLATSLGDVLTSVGHRVRLAHDGRAAYDAALEAAPDVALLDIGMPGLNGYDLARRLRMEPRTRNVVLVAITGWGQEADKLRAREAGFDHHLVKPVEPEALFALLQTSLDRDSLRAASS